MQVLRRIFTTCLLLIVIFTISTAAWRLPAIQKTLKKDGYVAVTELPNGNQLFFSTTEVSNEQYREFITYLKTNQRSNDLVIAQVDSAAWTNTFAYNAPYVNYYFQHTAYDNYPVVNITYEGAQLYCEWLTAQYKNKGYTVKVRLPEADEWMLAAQGGNKENLYGWEGNAINDKKGNPLANYQWNVEKAIIVSPVTSYAPNAFGIYHMSGNVAEMLQTKGTHKGGSWFSAQQYVTVLGDDEYKDITTASPFIGFRTVIEVSK